MKPAAIMASLVDVRNISAHKCVRLEVHVPAEQAGAVLAAFGWPTMADPVPVAIARLVPEKAASEPRKGEETPKRAWSDLPPAQQAGIRCNEPAFWRFLGTICEGDILTELDAACEVRRRCGVASRSEILPARRLEQRWNLIESAYQAWLTEAAHV